MAYAGITLYNWTDKVRSHAGLGIAGVILVAVSIAAGLGIAALVGITFNASTTQIVPFLSLGLGVDAVFLLVHTFTLQTPTNIPAKVRFALLLTFLLQAFNAKRNFIIPILT